MLLFFLSMLSGTKRVQMQRSSSSVSPRKSLKNIDYLKNTNLNDTYHVKKYLKSVHDPSMPQLCLTVASHITLVDFADLFYSGTVRMLKHVLCLVSWKKGSFPLVVNHERALKTPLQERAYLADYQLCHRFFGVFLTALMVRQTEPLHIQWEWHLPHVWH